MLYILNFYLDKTKLLFSFVKKQLEVEVCALQSWGCIFLAAKKVEEGNVVIFLTYLLCSQHWNSYFAFSLSATAAPIWVFLWSVLKIGTAHLLKPTCHHIGIVDIYGFLQWKNRWLCLIERLNPHVLMAEISFGIWIDYLRNALKLHFENLISVLIVRSPIIVLLVNQCFKSLVSP